MTRRITFPGYESNHSHEEVARDYLLLREHIPLLLANQQRIEDEPVYFYCQPAGALLSTAYISGGPLVLGMLLKLWRSEHFLEKCPQCGGTLFVLQRGGSILSGSNGWSGVCPSCESDHSGKMSLTWRTDWKEALHLLKAYPNERIVEEGARARFSWSQGIVGTNEPDIVLKDSIKGLPLPEVIDRLNAHMTSLRSILESAMKRIEELEKQSMSESRFHEERTALKTRLKNGAIDSIKYQKALHELKTQRSNTESEARKIMDSFFQDHFPGCTWDRRKVVLDNLRGTKPRTEP